jgi:hypothetical protein
MRILLIAPANPDLPSISAEIAAITRHHDVTLVVDIVREIDIQDAVEKGHPFDVIWWATHGGPDGVLLAVGHTIDASAMTDYVERSEARLCVLNTCDSEEVAYRIIAGGRADMIYTITADIKDPEALRLATQLSIELAESDDFEAAFDKVKGARGAVKYRFLKATAALRSLTLAAQNAAERLLARVEELERSRYKADADMQTLTERVTQMVAQSLSTQQQVMATQRGDRQIADLDRNIATRQPAIALSPTFWLLLVAMAMVAVFFLARAF